MAQKLQSEFIVRQYYTVHIDEDQIDTHRHEYSPDSKGGTEWIEEEFTRLHRMFKAILADEEALYAVLEYQVICEHDCNSDGSGGYIEEHYGKLERYFNFPVLLMSVAHCFAQEDRAYLQELVARNAASHQEGRDGYSLDNLSDCFKVEASGWNVEPHTH